MEQNLISYTLVCKTPDDHLWLQPLKPSMIPDPLTDDVAAILQSMARRENVTLIGSIRAREENGEVIYYHAFEHPPSDLEQSLMNSAVWYLGVGDGTLLPDARERVERAIEDMKLLEAIGAR